MPREVQLPWVVTQLSCLLLCGRGEKLEQVRGIMLEAQTHFTAAAMKTYS